MNANVQKAINNLLEVLEKEMSFIPQHIDISSFDHYPETENPNIPLELAARHGFKHSHVKGTLNTVDLTEKTNGYTKAKIIHYFHKTEDDLPKEEEEIIAQTEWEEWESDKKHQQYEYRQSKI